MTVQPFNELTLDQIKRIMDLCNEIREDSWRKNPGGWHSPDDCMNSESCPQEFELDALYKGLSRLATQELIALKLFGHRIYVRANHWKTDMKEAERQLSNRCALEGHGVGLHFQTGLQNLSKVRLIPGMPVWDV